MNEKQGMNSKQGQFIAITLVVMVLMVVLASTAIFLWRIRAANYQAANHAYDDISRLEFRPAVALQKSRPPITDIPVRLVSEVAENETELMPNFLVLGVTVNGESRAYPLNQLVGPEREIFNDELGGLPIMPTW